MCGVVVETEADRVISIRGDAEDPFSRGHVCPKAMGLKDVYEDTDRLRRPVIRGESGTFRACGWDEALDYAAAGLRRVQQRHGTDAVAEYQGNPTVHNLGILLFSPLLYRTLGTKNYFSAVSLDQLPHLLTCYLMFGHQALIPIPDLDRTDMLLVLGANPLVSQGSLMTAGDVGRRLRQIQQRGGRIVVLDPRRTETAREADEHHFIRPGSDALVLLAILNTLFREGLVRLGHLSECIHGVDEVAQVVARFPPERVAGAVGIGADTILSLARQFALADRAACYGRIGACTQAFGSLTCWLINVLNIVTGNLDRAGGVMFPRPAVDVIKATPLMAKGAFARWRSRVRGLPEFGGELPTSALAEEMETDGKGRIRGLLSAAGNPVLSAPSGARLDRALAGLDFMVAIDPYINETTRHAHVILPPTTALEQEHYDLALHMIQVRNTAKFSPAAVPREPGTRHDWEIFNELAWRLGRGPLRRRIAHLRAKLLARIGPRGMLDVLLRLGPHGDRYNPWSSGLNLARLEQAPHGVDLGALQPALPNRLCTKDRRIVLAPIPLLGDVARVEQLLSAPPRPTSSLRLIGRRELRSKNSWLHNSPRMVKGPPRCTLQMHVDDARARGLCDGASVRVSSRTGSIVLPVEPTPDIMPGVVSIPHGWGHGRLGVQLRIASERPGVSINDITDDACVDGLSGNAAFSGVSVVVEECGAARRDATESSSLQTEP
jgi:anaerobic selenocysteine-containing dehydrogenase